VGDRVSVYLLPLADHMGHPRSLAAATKLATMAADGPEGSGLRKATSTDSWHATLAANLARACAIEGLGFLIHELRVLSPDEAGLAAKAVDELLSRLESGDVPEAQKSFGRQWTLIISQSNFAEALASVAPCVDADEENGETESFLEFLVSLQIAASEAVDSTKNLLYFREKA
jgi:hypothetical protein